MKITIFSKKTDIFSKKLAFNFLKQNWSNVSMGIQVFLLTTWCTGAMFLALYALTEYLPFYFTFLPVILSLFLYYLFNKKPNIAKKIEEPFLSTSSYNNFTGKAVTDLMLTFLLTSLGLFVTSIFLKILIENDIIPKNM